MVRRPFSGGRGAGALGGAVLALGVLALGVLAACDSMMNSPDPYAPTGGPAAAQGRTSRMDDVPYCPGGKRDKGCLFGTNCRVTSQGCQVCQCEGLDD
jgi:hypothetical protein